jgi:hypothetical protein
MANYSNRSVRSDKYGRPTSLCKCKPNKNGYPEGYIELGGSLYKFAVSNNLKDGGYWVSVTKMVKRSNMSM